MVGGFSDCQTGPCLHQRVELCLDLGIFNTQLPHSLDSLPLASGCQLGPEPSEVGLKLMDGGFEFILPAPPTRLLPLSNSLCFPFPLLL